MLDPEIETAIRDAVDAGFAGQTAFTAEIVASPSVRGREQPAQNLMAAAMRERGLAVDAWRIDPETIRHMPGFSPVTVNYDQATTVVGAWRAPDPRGRSLILNGHIDVVPAGPEEMWAIPPVIIVISSEFVIFGMYGAMMIGASVCPMKMFAETARDSAPEMRSSCLFLRGKT